MAPPEVPVRMVNIVKRFPGVVANAGVTFEAAAGEVHALLGENGAGKTTLMNILYGIYQPDEGEIYIRGQRVHIRSPRDAISLGIGMVHQHFMLVHPHTVAENIVLGMTDVPFAHPDRAVREKIAEFSERYGLRVDPDAYIWQLSAGEQQRVEIVKALYRGAEILILDEPTSMLTPQETKELFTILRRMAEEGRTIIFITHKLEEVMAVSDRVTVLRKGKVVGTMKTSETNQRELARLMVGREVLFQLDKPPVKPGKVVLQVENLNALNDKGVPALRDVSFTIREGEILGIAGVAGNGQKELVEVITGLRPATSGQVLIDGEDVTNKAPREILAKGVAHVPEERMHMGMVPNMSIAENLILKTYDRPPFSKGWFLDPKAIREHAERVVREYGVSTPSIWTPVKLLSGGNIQRVILARELSTNPRLIVAAHPTYGLDVGATEYVRKLLIEQRNKGVAILLVSEDLEEIFALSDRIAVMFGGRIMDILDAESADVETVGALMAGIKPGGEAN